MIYFTRCWYGVQSQYMIQSFKYMKLKEVLFMDQSIFPIIGKESTLPLIVTGVGGHFNQHPIVRPKGYHEYQFLYCVKGSGVFYIDGKEYDFHKNTGFLLYPNISHEYHAIDSPWETHWVSFVGGSLPSLLATFGFEKSEFVQLSKIHLLEHLLHEILIMAQSESLQKGFHCSSLLYQFLVELKQSITTDVSTSNRLASQSEQMLTVTAYIEEHFHSSPTLEELSALIQVSPQYLCRLFKNLFNMRPFEYINKRRIQEAKRFLLEYKLSIKEIASKTGYNDTSYFCTIFKKYEGVSPVEFRNLHL